MDIAYPPGYPILHVGPLARFLPPLEEGSVSLALERFGMVDGLVLDPFGVSPRLAVEVAHTGRPIIVAANNPITRFVIERTVKPFRQSELQSALAHLAAASKDGTRLEPFLLELYNTRCIKCGVSVNAEYFVWERDANSPHLKVYACDRCNYVGDGPTDEEDRERARSFSRTGLQQALALERVAPPGDADRAHAEIALSVYTDRALYALITLSNKLEQLHLESHIRTAAQALTLSAFDACNSMWGHPEGRRRPRQLIASSEFREVNIWRALERAVGTWAMDDPALQSTLWPSDRGLESGTVALFPGPVRDLLPTLSDLAVGVFLTVLPRPSQAYWTLSALWAGWLWGKEAAASIKVALRRRRYDWAWHAAAMRTVLTNLGEVLDRDTPSMAFVPEAEPGFSAAALAAFDAAGFKLTGRAVRLDEAQAFFTWQPAEAHTPLSPSVNLESQMELTVTDVVRMRGEPVPYALMHLAAASNFAEGRQLTALWESEGAPPTSKLGDMLEAIIRDRRTFIHLSRGAEPESGLHWLTDPSEADPPLTDRIEGLVLDILRRGERFAAVEVDDLVCQELPGLLTPDRRLVRVCLSSYGVEDAQDNLWRLREEDQPDAREADCQEMMHLLIELGLDLGYNVEEGEQVVWKDEREKDAYVFRIMESAMLGTAFERDTTDTLTIVLPGGRAALVAEKARRDPRLREWLQSGARVIKFRLVRRLAEEAGLSQLNFEERLIIDPPQYHDPQLPLL
jgi:hypothetical protein